MTVTTEPTTQPTGNETGDAQTELTEAQLEQVQGGIIAILIGRSTTSDTTALSSPTTFP